MAAKKQKTYFARGAGCITVYADSETALIDWNGRADGSARFVPHVKRWVRGGVEHASKAALLRAIEREHTHA